MVEVSASATTSALAWLVSAVMYHLALSIKVIIRKMSSETAKFRRTVFNLVAVTMALIFFILVLCARSYLETTQGVVKVVTYLFDASYGILFVVFTAIIINMIVTLDLMRKFFVNEYRHTILQFLLFWVAIVVKLVLQALFTLGSAREWTDFSFAIMWVISHLFVDILPYTYMLYSHHRTFSRESKKVSLETSAASS